MDNQFKTTWMINLRKARQQWIQERPRDEETQVSSEEEEVQEVQVKKTSAENFCETALMEQTEETTDRRKP